MAEGRIYLACLLAVDTGRPGAPLERHRERAPGLRRDRSSAALFATAYDTAYAFVFNDFLRQCLDRAYLGHEVGETPYGRLGAVRGDYLLLRNLFYGASFLHAHFCFADNRFDLSRPEPDKVAQVVAFQRALLGGSTGLAGLDLLCRGLAAPPRRFAYGGSRYLYTSLCDQPPELLEEDAWKSHALTLWSLLWQQDRGAREARAEASLEACRWSPASFFHNFHQPGAMLSLSAAYPGDTYGAHRAHFLPSLAPHGQLLQRGQPPAVPAAEAPSYDHLPEHPALRYLALPMLEYGGWVEETLRSLHEELLAMSASVLRPWRVLWRLRRIEERFFRSQVLDVLRLPVTRDFALALVDDKKLERTRESVRDLQTSALNGLLLALTLLGLLLAAQDLLPWLASWLGSLLG